jgi:hypothetical protein
MLCQQQQISEELQQEIKEWYNGYSYVGDGVFAWTDRWVL